ncbi:MAG: head GIN domain-containing protein [Pseudomonadota bacterium]
MQNSIPLTAGAIALGLVVPAIAGSNNFDFTDFDKVAVERGVEVNIVSGDDFHVAADASRQSLLRRLEIRQVGDTLKISRTGKSFFLFGLADRYEVDVTLPTLAGVNASSGAEVEVRGAVTDRLEVRASSGSEVDLEGVSPSDLIVKVSSGAEVQASGSCATLNVRGSSGGEVDAEDMVCDVAEIRTSSGADVTAHVTDMLAAQASSGSDIDIIGNPTVTRDDTSSGGKLAMVN